MNISGVVPKIIAIFFGILVAVSLAMFGFSAVKNGVSSMTSKANSAIQSVTGDDSFSIGGGDVTTGNDGVSKLNELGNNIQNFK